MSQPEKNMVFHRGIPEIHRFFVGEVIPFDGRTISGLWNVIIYQEFVRGIWWKMTQNNGLDWGNGTGKPWLDEDGDGGDDDDVDGHGDGGDDDDDDGDDDDDDEDGDRLPK